MRLRRRSSRPVPVRAQNFIREVRKGREKRATADFFEIPPSKMRSILDRTQANYDVSFDNDQWQIERAKVKAGEKPLAALADWTIE
nr:hypothetical protein [Halocatena pleomorpha]